MSENGRLRRRFTGWVWNTFAGVDDIEVDVENGQRREFVAQLKTELSPLAWLQPRSQS